MSECIWKQPSKLACIIFDVPIGIPIMCIHMLSVLYIIVMWYDCGVHWIGSVHTLCARNAEHLVLEVWLFV